MMKILLLSLTILLSSCGPSFYLKRAERAIKKAEQLGATVSRDTSFIDKSVVVPEVKTDTIFKPQLGDTIFISKDKLKIKYVKLPGDSVFIEGKCEADTVRIKVPVTITKKIKAGATTWDLIILAIVCLIVGFILGLFKRR